MDKTYFIIMLVYGGVALGVIVMFFAWSSMARAGSGGAGTKVLGLVGILLAVIGWILIDYWYFGDYERYGFFEYLSVWFGRKFG